MAEIAGVETPIAAPTEDRLSALFVTDDRELSELYQLKLSIDGYDLRVAGREEARAGTLPTPDLLFFDLEDGTEAAINVFRRVRNATAFLHVPAILLSSAPESTLVDRGLHLGPLDHVLPVARLSGVASLLDLDGITRLPGALSIADRLVRRVE